MKTRSNTEASEFVAERVRALRKARGMTVDDLAARCAGLGAPELTTYVLYSLQSGRPGTDGQRRRHVTVDELLTFATVFGMKPSDLLDRDCCATCGNAPPLGFSCDACGLRSG